MEHMIDPTALRRLYQIGKPFWLSEKRWKALGVLITVLVLLFVSAHVSVYIGSQAGLSMTAYQLKHKHEFYEAIAKFPRHFLWRRRFWSITSSSEPNCP